MCALGVCPAILVSAGALASARAQSRATRRSRDQASRGRTAQPDDAGGKNRPAVHYSAGIPTGPGTARAGYPQKART